MFLSVFSSSSEFRYLEWGVGRRWELLFCSNILLKTSHIYSPTIYIEMYLLHSSSVLIYLVSA